MHDGNSQISQSSTEGASGVGGETSSALPVIQMFWHGPKLSRIERVCMASFVAHGHPVHVYVYDAIDVPQGIEVRDARQILPGKNLFRHPKTGSLAMFADWFRYRVLFDKGGIWADTDVICLQPLNFSHAEIYAWEDEVRINNAVLGLPAGHELAAWMADCCEYPNKIRAYDAGAMKRRKWRRRWLQGNRRENVKWGENGPTGFTLAARHLGYADRALPSWNFYPLHYRDWQKVFDGSLQEDSPLLAKSSALHLWNEMLRREAGFDKNARFPRESLFEQLCARYLPDEV